MAAGQQQLPPTGLPVEDAVPDLKAALSEFRAAVLVAEPGAGKTTLVPLRLLSEPWLGNGRIVVLEPRRVAARAAAQRMAYLLGEDVGTTVGYVTRDERRIGPATRIEVVTDGVLTRRLQRDPELAGTGLVVFDEFHERHLQADLGLALTLDARSGLRPDLRVLVMSATLDAEPVGALLGGAPVITSVGRAHPVEVRWQPMNADGRLTPAVTAAIRDALRRDTGDVLVFLPGVGEIRGAADALGTMGDVEVWPLHGSLSAAEQDRALRPAGGRRVVLSTDLAESSVTVDGVGVVVDSGLARRPAYDPTTGLTRLRTVVASRASADQRAGRAGRNAAGVAYRLWPKELHHTRRAWSDPEISTVDLASLVLELAVWGAPANSLRWLTPPPSAAMSTATQLLDELGALRRGRPTELGRRLVGLPLHPRLARMLLVAPAADRRAAALLAALLSERDIFRRDHNDGQLTSDVASRLSVLMDGTAPPHTVDRATVSTVRRRADELARRVRDNRPEREGSARGTRRTDPGPLLAEAYPDRIAQRRGAGRYRLRHGAGAVLPDHDPLARSEWLVVAEVTGAQGRSSRADGQIRLAAALDRSDVERIGGEGVKDGEDLRWDAQLDDLRVTTNRTLDSLDLGSSSGPARAGEATTAALVSRAVQIGLSVLGWTAAARSLQVRAAWARRQLGDSWPDVSDDALQARAEEWLAPLLQRATGRADLARVDPSAAIRAAIGGRMKELDRLAPSSFELPAGRRAHIDYSDDQPRAAIRVQDLFGTTVHPSVMDGRTPVTLELLSPAGRPIQITADLPGFWRGSWRQIRKEMHTRYPKHDWPDDPASAVPPQRRPPSHRPRQTRKH